MKLDLKPIDLIFQNGNKEHLHVLGGQPVPGCSTIAKLFDDGGWKCAWAAKMATEKTFELMYSHQSNSIMPGNGIKILEIEMLGILSKAKSAWREKRDTAADSGTFFHGVLEQYIKAKMDGHGIDLYSLTPDEFMKPVRDFIRWEEINEIEWLASEIQVGSVKHQFAGIADFVCRMNGKTYVGDFKTGKNAYAEANIQLAGLQICLEEMGCDIDGRLILHMPKNGAMRATPATTDIEQDKAAFLAAREFYKHHCIFKARAE